MDYVSDNIIREQNTQCEVTDTDKMYQIEGPELELVTFHMTLARYRLSSNYYFKPTTSLLYYLVFTEF